VNVVDRADVLRWVDAYERAWRTAGTDHLGELFAPDATYRPSPWAEPVTGPAALATFWEGARDGADEPFTMAREVVAVDGDVGVVRVAVEYGRTGDRWRDLWIVRFGADGRCVAFEEWPFAPRQPDGH
jgi:ketosteroid isomerase-like protein